MRILSLKHYWAMSWRVFLTFAAITYLGQLAFLWGKEKTLFCEGIRYCHPSGEVVPWGIFIMGNGILLLLPLLIVFIVLREEKVFWKKQISNGFSHVEEVAEGL